MNTITEPHKYYSKIGSFWTDTITDTERGLCRLLNNIPTEWRGWCSGNRVSDKAVGNSPSRDAHVVIHFKDKDVIHFGSKEALQKRYNGSRERFLDLGHRVIPTVQEMMLGNVFPYTIPYGDNSLTLSGGDQLVWGLKIDPELCVTSINVAGETMLAGNDFATTFGYLLFRENPISLFPKNTIYVPSCVRRSKNIMCYPLGITDVYGRTDRVTSYYKSNQSVKAFSLAALQAAGFAVIQNDCKVLSVDRLHYGYIYTTTDGYYEANYNHTPLSVGNFLQEGYVIGNENSVGDPYVTITSNPGTIPVTTWPSADLDTLITLKGLSVSRSFMEIEVKDGKEFPQLTGSDSALVAYEAYVSKYAPTTELTETYTVDDGLTYFASACSSALIYAAIDREELPARMQRNLDKFMSANCPVGGIIVYMSKDYALPAGVTKISSVANMRSDSSTVAGDQVLDLKYSPVGPWMIRIKTPRYNTTGAIGLDISCSNDEETSFNTTVWWSFSKNSTYDPDPTFTLHKSKAGIWTIDNFRYFDLDKADMSIIDATHTIKFFETSATTQNATPVVISEIELVDTQGSIHYVACTDSAGVACMCDVNSGDIIYSTSSTALTAIC